jgi:alpha-amylase
MKNLLILILLLFAAFSVHAKKVQFAVDLTGITINSTGVHVTGDFQEEAGYEGGDWMSNTTVMTALPGSAIYTVVVDIPAFRKYEYKFLNGDQFYDVEFVPVESRVGYEYNDDRWVYVDSLYTDTLNIPAVLFSGNAPAGMYLVKLKVDMQSESEISARGVHVAGDFQGWDPSSVILYNFVNKVYEVIDYVDTTAGYAKYRFVNGNTAEDYETVPSGCAVSGNRSLDVLKDTVIETVCFSQCSACGSQSVSYNEKKSDPGIYPNPFKDKTQIIFNDDQPLHDVIIMDIFGKSVRNYDNYRYQTLSIQRGELKQGIYFLKISNGKGWLSTSRLVITD